jgi:hypothetical protein
MRYGVEAKLKLRRVQRLRRCISSTFCFAKQIKEGHNQAFDSKLTLLYIVNVSWAQNDLTKLVDKKLLLIREAIF